MKKGLTEMVMILDASGSMYELTKDTIGGYNSMIDKQKKEEGDALVSLVTFNDTSTVLCDRMPINKVEPLTDRQYVAGGCTALIDAIGGAIHHISNVHKYIRQEDVPEHTLFVIITDGYENASRRYSSAEVKRRIAEKEKQGWEFIFLGANIDAVNTAARIGIKRQNAVDFICDEIAMPKVMESVSGAVSYMRAGNACVKEDWAEEVKKDYKARKKW